MDHIFFIHSSVEGHLGSFHSLAIADIAAVNIGVHLHVTSDFLETELLPACRGRKACW